MADQGIYQKLIGKVLYITMTRPDVSFCVQTLSQFLQAPKQFHMEAAVKIVIYLKKEPGQGVLLSSNNNMIYQPIVMLTGLHVLTLGSL